MDINRRVLLGSTVPILVPMNSGCLSSVADQDSGATEPKTSSGRGAGIVYLHNVHEDPITLSIRAEIIDRHQKRDEDVPIDDTIRIDSAETYEIVNKLLYQSKYALSVALESGYSEEAEWTPDVGQSGLHIIYDGSDNVIFAEEFA